MTRTNGLVLGAGGARGYAHIGVLQALTRAGVRMDLVVGCSAGAIAGALYASGQDMDQVEKLFAYPGFSKRLLDISLSREGLVKGDKLLDVIRLLTKDAKFEDLPMPLAIVATDIERGELVVFREGSVAHAVRASISIPGFFKPYRYRERLLVDGAVINRLPVHVAREMGADKVLAVDVKKEEMTKITSAKDVLLRSLEVLEEEVFRFHCFDADYLLQPGVGQIGTYQLERAEEGIKIGRDSTEAKLEEIKKIFA